MSYWLAFILSYRTSLVTFPSWCSHRNRSSLRAVNISNLFFNTFVYFFERFLGKPIPACILLKNSNYFFMKFCEQIFFSSACKTSDQIYFVTGGCETIEVYVVINEILIYTIPLTEPLSCQLNNSWFSWNFTSFVFINNTNVKLQYSDNGK